MERLRKARTCYGHVAGELGVAIEQALSERGLILLDGTDYMLTDEGETALSNLSPAVRRSRRIFARVCLDWSERRFHVGGALGAALAERLLDLGWLRSVPGRRSLHLTDTGRIGLRTAFGLDLEPGGY